MKIQQTSIDSTIARPVINSHNEWDTLQEVVVGHVLGAVVPPLDPCVKVNSPERYWNFFKEWGHKPFSQEEVESANLELEEFCRILQGEGIKVRRPELVDFSASYQTPEFQSTGLYAAMPRDIWITIGDELIEAPMAWRSRYFEYRAYRNLANNYLRQGGRWTTAPKATMSDKLYDYEFANKTPDEQKELVKAGRYVTTEFEPCFDAADFVRFGRDIFVQRSHVTNKMGINWLRGHLGDRYRVHLIEFADTNPMHIDASLVPIRPGLALINPKRPPHPQYAQLFKKAGWDLIEAACPTTPDTWKLPIASKWISMNILSLDPQRIVVESQEEPTHRQLRDLGFETIPVDFRYFYTFGGSFHCATCDIRRESQLESYGFENFLDSPTLMELDLNS
jgi:glycine amidinotransferase